MTSQWSAIKGERDSPMQHLRRKKMLSMDSGCHQDEEKWWKAQKNIIDEILPWKFKFCFLRATLT